MGRWVINGGKLVEMGEKWVRGRQRPVFANAVVGEKEAIHRWGERQKMASGRNKRG